MVEGRGREGKRKTRLDRMVENRGKVVPLQPSPRHTGTFSHSFSVSSFACFPAPTGYNTSPTSPPTRQEAFCACTGIVYASLDNAARRQDAIRFETAVLRVQVGQWSESSWRNYRLLGKIPRARDGEFIVASWVPLLPIRFREAGSRMRKEATGCLSMPLLLGVLFRNGAASPVRE